MELQTLIPLWNQMPVILRALVANLGRRMLDRALKEDNSGRHPPRHTLLYLIALDTCTLLALIVPIVLIVVAVLSAPPSSRSILWRLTRVHVPRLACSCRSPSSSDPTRRRPAHTPRTSRPRKLPRRSRNRRAIPRKRSGSRKEESTRNPGL